MLNLINNNYYSYKIRHKQIQIYRLIWLDSWIYNNRLKEQN